MRRWFEPGPGGAVSLEPQPFLERHEAAPKTQWVMVAALWSRPSDWLDSLRLLWGRFEGKGVIGRRSPFPVADSPETTPPSPGLKRSMVAAGDSPWSPSLSALRWTPCFIVHRASLFEKCLDPFPPVRVFRAPFEGVALLFKLMFKRGVKGIG
jgi:hypothetical protein